MNFDLDAAFGLAMAAAAGRGQLRLGMFEGRNVLIWKPMK